MPFGPDCEFPDFESCVKKYTGKKKDPEAYCATVRTETEDHCKKRLMRAIRGDSEPPHRRWTYDVEAGAFRNMENGALLEPARLADLLGDFISVQMERALKEVSELAVGNSTVPEWEIAMRRVIKESYGVAYLLGRGGRNMMDFHDWGRVGRMVQMQYGWLNGFAREVSGGQLSAEKASQRVQLYVGAARQAFSKSHAVASGDVPLPNYPGDGSTRCLGNCDCRWDIKVDPAGGWLATWRLGETDHCEDCTDRAARWAPLKLGGPTV